MHGAVYKDTLLAEANLRYQTGKCLRHDFVAMRHRELQMRFGKEQSTLRLCLDASRCAIDMHKAFSDGARRRTCWLLAHRSLDAGLCSTRSDRADALTAWFPDKSVLPMKP